jgi:hypothetical protein
VAHFMVLTQKFLEGTGRGEVRDNSFGIATRYGLDGPGIGSRWGREFSHPSKTGPGTHPVSYTMDTGSLSRG